MNSEENLLLVSVQDGIPLTMAPFRDVGTLLGWTEAEVTSRLRTLIRDGTVRRFGARIDHRKLGIVANAMVCWRITDDKVEEVGTIIAGHPRVSHCYERAVIPGIWEYNLFCVLHGYSTGEVEMAVRKIEESAGISGHIILYSEKKFKHTPVTITRKEHS